MKRRKKAKVNAVVSWNLFVYWFWTLLALTGNRLFVVMIGGMDSICTMLICFTDKVPPSGS